MMKVVMLVMTTTSMVMVTWLESDNDKTTYNLHILAGSSSIAPQFSHHWPLIRGWLTGPPPALRPRHQTDPWNLICKFPKGNISNFANWSLSMRLRDCQWRESSGTLHSRRSSTKSIKCVTLWAISQNEKEIFKKRSILSILDYMFSLIQITKGRKLDAYNLVFISFIGFVFDEFCQTNLKARATMVTATKTTPFLLVNFHPSFRTMGTICRRRFP